MSHGCRVRYGVIILVDGRGGIACLFADLEHGTTLVDHLRDGTATGSTPGYSLRDADLFANLLYSGVHLFVDMPDTVHPAGWRHSALLENREDIVHVSIIAVLLDQVGCLVGQDHSGFVRIFGSFVLYGVAFDPTPLHMTDVDPGHSGGVVTKQEQVEPEPFPFPFVEPATVCVLNCQDRLVRHGL